MGVRCQEVGQAVPQAVAVLMATLIMVMVALIMVMAALAMVMVALIMIMMVVVVVVVVAMRVPAMRVVTVGVVVIAVRPAHARQRIGGAARQRGDNADGAGTRGVLRATAETATNPVSTTGTIRAHRRLEI